MNRQPPHSLPAEEAVLSCCLMDGAVSLSNCLNAGLKSEHFYNAHNGAIFAKLEEMLATGKTVELSVLMTELQAVNQLSEIGGMPYLLKISGSQATTISLTDHIERIVNLATLRKVILEAGRLTEKCYGFSGDMSDTLDSSVSKLISLASGGTQTEESNWDGLVSQSEAILESIIEHKGLPANMIIPFPWPEMNEAFNPMQRGQLTILAARPSVGKSSMAVQMAVETARNALKTYFVTLEVGPERIPLQIASKLKRIGLKQVATAHHKDQDELRQALKGLRGLGFTVSRRDRSCARILGRAMALHAKDQLDLLVVDHGLLVEDIASSKRDELLANISRFTKSLKRIAGDLNVAVLLLWQLNRSSAKEGNREPNLTDLKECGSLEEDADKVIFLHRPNMTSDGIEQKETASVRDQPRWQVNAIQAKGRDDGTAFLPMSFERQCAAFTPIKNP